MEFCGDQMKKTTTKSSGHSVLTQLANERQVMTSRGEPAKNRKHICFELLVFLFWTVEVDLLGLYRWSFLMQLWLECRHHCFYPENTILFFK